MSYQPPPPPPQGPPPGGPPPPPQGPPPQGPPPGGPPGQWGPPPGQGGRPGRPGGSFDPKSVNQLDWGILGAGLLAFIFSFVDYYSYSLGGQSISDSAWHGFFGWFAMLLALVGSVAVALDLFMPHVKLPFPNRLIGLGAYALAALCVILAIFIIPSSVCSGGLCGDVPDSVDKGHAFGFWISLIVILVGAVLSFMRFTQTGGQLPIGGNRGGGFGAIGGGHHGQQQSGPQAGQQPGGYGPPQGGGYQQPPQSGGYGSQQGPPPPPAH